MNEINAAISASNGINPSTGKHFTEYIDQFSWLRHHWLNTLAMNVDGFRLSGYYYKHRSDTNDGKVGAGPIWDFDRTMGSTDSRDNNPSQWDGSGDSSRTWSDGRYAWWGQVLSKPDFRQAHTDLWQDLRENVFSTENIEASSTILHGKSMEGTHLVPTTHHSVAAPPRETTISGAMPVTAMRSEL